MDSSSNCFLVLHSVSNMKTIPYLDLVLTKTNRHLWTTRLTDNMTYNDNLIIGEGWGHKYFKNPLVEIFMHEVILKKTFCNYMPYLTTSYSFSFFALKLKISLFFFHHVI